MKRFCFQWLRWPSLLPPKVCSAKQTTQTKTETVWNFDELNCWYKQINTVEQFTFFKNNTCTSRTIVTKKLKQLSYFLNSQTISIRKVLQWMFQQSCGMWEVNRLRRKIRRWHRNPDEIIYFKIVFCSIYLFEFYQSGFSSLLFWPSLPLVTRKPWRLKYIWVDWRYRVALSGKSKFTESSKITNWLNWQSDGFIFGVWLDCILFYPILTRVTSH